MSPLDVPVALALIASPFLAFGATYLYFLFRD